MIPLQDIIQDLLKLLMLENGLLKEMKLKMALQHVDQKDQLMNRLSQEIHLLKNKSEIFGENKLNIKDHLQQEIQKIQTIAKENDHLLQKINLVNQRIIDRMMKRIQKLGAPMNFYTAQGKKTHHDLKKCSLVSAMTLSNQV